jgi:hypothetical protein
VTERESERARARSRERERMGELEIMGGRKEVGPAAALAVLPPSACLTYDVNPLVSSARAQDRRTAASAGQQTCFGEIKRHEKPRVLFSETNGKYV